MTRLKVLRALLGGQHYVGIISDYLKWPKNIQKIQKRHIMDLKQLYAAMAIVSLFWVSEILKSHLYRPLSCANAKFWHFGQNYRHVIVQSWQTDQILWTCNLLVLPFHWSFGTLSFCAKCCWQPVSPISKRYIYFVYHVH